MYCNFIFIVKTFDELEIIVVYSSKSPRRILLLYFVYVYVLSISYTRQFEFHCNKTGSIESPKLHFIILTSFTLIFLIYFYYCHGWNFFYIGNILYFCLSPSATLNKKIITYMKVII